MQNKIIMDLGFNVTAEVLYRSTSCEGQFPNMVATKVSVKLVDTIPA